MSLIMTPIEFVRDWMDHAADCGADQFSNAVRPIYGMKKGIPFHIGTCLFIEWEEQHYILTAAHVSDWQEKTTLYVGAGEELVKINDVFRATPKPAGDRDKDPYDFAYLKLSEKTLEGYKSLEYITAEKIVP